MIVDPCGFCKVWLCHVGIRWSAAQEEERLRVGLQCLVQGSALSPMLEVTLFNCPDHLRVARWDFFDDRGPAIIRLPSTSGLASELAHRHSSPRSSRKLTTVAITCDHRHSHERVLDGYQRAGLRAVLTSIAKTVRQWSHQLRCAERVRSPWMTGIFFERICPAGSSSTSAENGQSFDVVSARWALFLANKASAQRFILDARASNRHFFENSIWTVACRRGTLSCGIFWSA